MMESDVKARQDTVKEYIVGVECVWVEGEFS